MWLFIEKYLHGFCTYIYLFFLLIKSDCSLECTHLKCVFLSSIKFCKPLNSVSMCVDTNHYARHYSVSLLPAHSHALKHIHTVNTNTHSLALAECWLLENKRGFLWMDSEKCSNGQAKLFLCCRKGSKRSTTEQTRTVIKLPTELMRSKTL